MNKAKILILLLVSILFVTLFTGCFDIIPKADLDGEIGNEASKASKVDYDKKILDVPYFDAQGITNGCGCAAGAMLMNYYNYLNVTPIVLEPYIMVWIPPLPFPPFSLLDLETFGALDDIKDFIKDNDYDDNLKTKIEILTIKEIKKKIDEGYPVAVVQYHSDPLNIHDLHYRVVHGYDDEKLEFICSCSLGEDYPMAYIKFLSLNFFPLVDQCPSLIVEPRKIDFSPLDVVPSEGSAPHEVNLAGWVRAVVSPFSCQVDFGDGTPIEKGIGNDFLSSVYHTYSTEGKFTPVLYIEDNLGRTGKTRANKVTVTQAENKIPFKSGDEFPVGSGYRWNVKNIFGGPGPNDFSDSIDNIWMDDVGQLHIRLTKKNNNKWNCIEIYSQKTGWGYGKYDFDFEIVSSGKIDENVVIGLFTYESEAPEVYNREIDYEYS